MLINYQKIKQINLEKYQQYLKCNKKKQKMLLEHQKNEIKYYYNILINIVINNNILKQNLVIITVTFKILQEQFKK